MAEIFVSHRGDDTKEAEQLALELRRSGHDVWLDKWEIELADSIVEKMQRGLDSAKYLIVCCSDSGVCVPWMSREWMSALARQLNGEDIKLLPVLLTGGYPPAILKDIKYVDLTNDWQNGVNQILEVIR